VSQRAAVGAQIFIQQKVKIVIKMM